MKMVKNHQGTPNNITQSHKKLRLYKRTKKAHQSIPQIRGQTINGKTTYRIATKENGTHTIERILFGRIVDRFKQYG